VLFDWGRDRPEPIDFQPMFRLEYGYNFSPTRSLVLAAEYGLRTDKLNNISSLGFSYRRYEAAYQFNW
jgi:biofilm PGA synthesis protein PgaA